MSSPATNPIDAAPRTQTGAIVLNGNDGLAYALQIMGRAPPAGYVNTPLVTAMLERARSQASSFKQEVEQERAERKEEAADDKQITLATILDLGATEGHDVALQMYRDAATTVKGRKGIVFRCSAPWDNDLPLFSRMVELLPELGFAQSEPEIHFLLSIAAQSIDDAAVGCLLQHHFGTAPGRWTARHTSSLEEDDVVIEAHQVEYNWPLEISIVSEQLHVRPALVGHVKTVWRSLMAYALSCNPTDPQMQRCLKAATLLWRAAEEGGDDQRIAGEELDGLYKHYASNTYQRPDYDFIWKMLDLLLDMDRAPVPVVSWLTSRAIQHPKESKYLEEKIKPILNWLLATVPETLMENYSRLTPMVLRLLIMPKYERARLATNVSLGDLLAHLLFSVRLAEPDDALQIASHYKSLPNESIEKSNFHIELAAGIHKLFSQLSYKELEPLLQDVEMGVSLTETDLNIMDDKMEDIEYTGKQLRERALILFLKDIDLKNIQCDQFSFYHSDYKSYISLNSRVSHTMQMELRHMRQVPGKIVLPALYILLQRYRSVSDAELIHVLTSSDDMICTDAHSSSPCNEPDEILRQLLEMVTRNAIAEQSWILELLHKRLIGCSSVFMPAFYNYSSANVLRWDSGSALELAIKTIKDGGCRESRRIWTVWCLNNGDEGATSAFWYQLFSEIEKRIMVASDSGYGLLPVASTDIGLAEAVGKVLHKALFCDTVVSHLNIHPAVAVWASWDWLETGHQLYSLEAIHAVIGEEWFRELAPETLEGFHAGTMKEGHHFRTEYRRRYAPILGHITALIAPIKKHHQQDMAREARYIPYFNPSVFQKMVAGNWECKLDWLSKSLNIGVDKDPYGGAMNVDMELWKGAFIAAIQELSLDERRELMIFWMDSLKISDEVAITIVEKTPGGAATAHTCAMQLSIQYVAGNDQKAIQQHILRAIKMSLENQRLAGTALLFWQGD
jgi:hypothetical protein